MQVQVEPIWAHYKIMSDPIPNAKAMSQIVY